MFFVYVLKSVKNSKRYIGQTSKLPEVRLREHNNGINVFTRNNGPFILVHSELFESRTDAIARERFLKSGKGRELLNNLLGR